MEKNVIIVIVLVVLVLLTAVQAIQLSALKTSINTGKVNVGSSAGSAPSTSSGSAPSSVQNLPSMVGGC